MTKAQRDWAFWLTIAVITMGICFAFNYSTTGEWW